MFVRCSCSSRFLSTLSLRRATRGEIHANSQQEFLSTLSLRRATVNGDVLSSCFVNFYPRSPCGERRPNPVSIVIAIIISIHALLAESDNLRVVDGSKSSIISIHALLAESDVTVLGIQHKVGISIHALLAESDHSAPVPRRPDANISIHALLAESDNHGQQGPAKSADFYPRSPCGERHPKINVCYGDFNFYPRSPCGERQSRHTRTTHNDTNFYPRSPCGERLGAPVDKMPSSSISIHALLAESDAPWSARLAPGAYFYPRSPCGERLSRLDAEY